jgi:hypothetical protein
MVLLQIPVLKTKVFATLAIQTDSGDDLSVRLGAEEYVEDEVSG